MGSCRRRSTQGLLKNIIGGRERELGLGQQELIFFLEAKAMESACGGGGGGLVAKPGPTIVTPRTIALQAPLSMGFPRQEYWSGLPFPSLGESS